MSSAASTSAASETSIEYNKYKTHKRRCKGTIKRWCLLIEAGYATETISCANNIQAFNICRSKYASRDDQNIQMFKVTSSSSNVFP